MRLAKLTEYRRLVFTPESAPAVSTLREQVKAGKIPGGICRGHRYYVDLDELDRATGLHASITARQRELAASPLLEGLL